MIKLLFFAGSCRVQSLNKTLAKFAEKSIDHDLVETTFINLAAYDIPLYNGDNEEAYGVPNDASTLKRIFDAHDGLFIASPEYNGSYSAVLKNTIDWLFRRPEDNLIPFKNKVVALASASPFAAGGLRGLVPLRMLMNNMDCHTVPSQFCLGHADKAFDDDGQLTDEHQLAMLNQTLDQWVETTIALNAQ
ncbi:MAG: NAD(P)H-dependent oxidoreductase [OCS116 cluster bacterium]|uniref:FMN reductase n=1 Tax=OCS116 cluster bacterium TaxID=2030921 RepID=A0A2A4Z6B0_9PROT|nr:NAD(P)H-dependent oxidoreductase [OCS116 cluster bacterium]